MIIYCVPLAFSQCFMHLDVCLIVENCVMLGLDWVEPMMQLFLARHMFMHISCIRTLSFLYFCYGLWWCVLSVYLSLSLSLPRIDCTWHPSANLLRLRTLFVPSHLLLLIFLLFTFNSMMRSPIRTSLRIFLNMAFIWSTMWFCQIFLTLLFPMSVTLGDGNLFMRYP